MDAQRIDIAGAKPGMPVRGKWLMDGANSLAEASAKLRDYADYLDALAVHGWTLAAPVDDDYGFLVDPTGNAGDTPDG
jgi:hypothetical protein